MYAILDRDGTTVAWLAEEDVLDLRGRFIGFIEYDGFYHPDDKFLGHFVKGLFIDAGGCTVAFTPDALAGPAKPRPLTPPPFPTLRERRAHRSTGISPRLPGISFGWSAQAWASYTGRQVEEQRLAA